MILKQTVRWTSEVYLREVLKTVPNALEYLFNPHRYDKFIDLLHERVNQLDIAGWVRSKYALDNFVKLATTAYAEKQLEKASIKSPFDEGK